MTVRVHKHAEQVPGPVQRQLLAELRAEFGTDFSIYLSSRSPFGRRAFRIQHRMSPDLNCKRECSIIADTLERKGWIESALSTGQSIYVRPNAATLRSWYASGGTACNQGQPGETAERVVICSDPVESDGAGSLGSYRAEVVAQAAAAQLRWHGANAVHRAGDADCARPTNPHERVITVGARAHDDAANIAVGLVEVEHGPLRARNGGSVHLRDLQALIQAQMSSQSIRTADSEPHRNSALSFVFARTPRRQHLRINEQRLTADIAAYGAIIEAAGVARDHSCSASTGSLDAAGEATVAELILELELMPWIASQATGEFEPATVLRYLISLARRIHDAGAHLGHQQDVSCAAGHAIAAGLSLAGSAGTSPATLTGQ